MKNMKTILPIAISIVIAITGSYFLYEYIEGQRLPQEIVQVKAEAVPVVVAAADLPWGTKIKPEMIKTTPYLKESMPAGYFSNITSLNGRVLLAPLKPNDPITHFTLPIQQFIFRTAKIAGG